jgi:hypothetical protein
VSDAGNVKPLFSHPWAISPSSARKPLHDMIWHRPRSQTQKGSETRLEGTLLDGYGSDVPWRQSSSVRPAKKPFDGHKTFPSHASM